MVVKIRGSIKRFNRWYFNFLRMRASMMSRLKGVVKVGKDPLSEEPPTLSTGAGRGPTPISKGVLLCFDVGCCPRPPLSLSYSKRGWVLGGTQVSIWALLIDFSGEGAPLLKCSCFECRECEDSSCSSYHVWNLKLFINLILIWKEEFTHIKQILFKIMLFS